MPPSSLLLHPCCPILSIHCPSSPFPLHLCSADPSLLPGTSGLPIPESLSVACLGKCSTSWWGATVVCLTQVVVWCVTMQGEVHRAARARLHWPPDHLRPLAAHCRPHTGLGQWWCNHHEGGWVFYVVWDWLKSKWEAGSCWGMDWGPLAWVARALNAELQPRQTPAPSYVWFDLWPLL